MRVYSLKTKITFCLAAAAVLSGVVFKAQIAARRSTLLGRELGLARQVAYQAEGMVMAARHNQEKDPVGWAVGFLSQGKEPRIIKLSKVGSLKGPAESYTIDESSGAFEYTKVLISEERSGVKIRLTEPIGMGLKATHAEADSLILLYFGVFCLAFFGLLSIYELAHGRGGFMHAEVRSKIAAAAELSRRLGGALVQTLRSINALVTLGNRTRTGGASLEQGLTTSLAKVEVCESLIARTDRLQQKSEAVALNVMLEASRLGDERSLVDSSRELLQLIREWRSSCLALQKAVIAAKAAAIASSEGSQSLSKAWSEAFSYIEGAEPSLVQAAGDLKQQVMILRKAG